MRRLVIPCAALALTLGGCEEETQKKPTAPAVEPAETAAPEPEPPPAPDYPDLDLEDLEQDLNCTESKEDACTILAAFGSAETWVFQPPSGAARYVGYAYERKQGKTERKILVLWAGVVPTAQVAPDAIPMQLGLQTLPEEHEREAVKLIRGVSRGNAPAAHNRAMPFIEEFEPNNKLGVVKTGRSLRSIAPEGSYFRQAGRRKLFMVSPSMAHGASDGDGLYAELHMVDW